MEDINIIELLDLVKEKNVRVEVIIEPDRQSVTIAPWKEYKPLCPLAKEDN